MINYLLIGFNQSSQAISIFLGGIVLTLFVYVGYSDTNPSFIFEWLISTLGYSFLIITAFLTFMAIISIININNCENRRRKFWFETGLQVSNLISTLALTYTLLGISLGIGELSSSKLDIDTINQTISKLTQQFSMAFMTSVIGLPLSGLLRSILIIIYEHFTVQSLKTSPKLLSK
jgi:hypothetical protein